MSTDTAASTAELKQKLQAHIAEARRKADELQQDLDVLEERDQEKLRQRSQEIRARIEAQRERLRELRVRLEEWQHEKASHTKEAIASWRQRRELHKLEARAEHAEDYAVNAVVIAVMDMDAAGEAVLDALAARMEADAATPTS